jgi:hypothetical protein
MLLRWVTGCVTLPLVLAHAVSSSAQSTAVACADAFERAQAEQTAGRFLAARADAAACASESCPDAIRAECVNLVASIADAVPSLVVVGQDAHGNDYVTARVLVDGAVVSEKLDGKPVDLDPGEHVIRVEPTTGEPLERRVVLVQGDKQRRIEIQFAEASTVAAERHQGDSAEPTGGSGMTVGLVVGGLGIAFFGVGAGLGVFGLVKNGDAHDLCDGDVKQCPEKNAAEARDDVQSARIFGGIGIGSLVLGTAGIVSGIVLLAQASDTAPPEAQQLALTLTASGFSLLGRF